MTEDIGAQLRRRREAADRLPPLKDGRRDPLDPETRPEPRLTCPACDTYIDPDGSCWTCKRARLSVA